MEKYPVRWPKINKFNKLQSKAGARDQVKGGIFGLIRNEQNNNQNKKKWENGVGFTVESLLIKLLLLYGHLKHLWPRAFE